MGDYFPRGDEAFLAWAERFAAGVENGAVSASQEASVLHAAMSAFQAAFREHRQAASAARAACQQKRAARAALMAAVRPIVRRLQADPATTDGQRVAMGLTVADPRRTSRSEAIALGRPTAWIDTSERLRHTIHFVDEATPTRRARPAGTLGCEIRRAIVAVNEPPPNDPASYMYLVLATATPFVAPCEPTDAGQTAYYVLRWLSTGRRRGSTVHGPWSTSVSATVVG